MKFDGSLTDMFATVAELSKLIFSAKMSPIKEQTRLKLKELISFNVIQSRIILLNLLRLK